MESTQFDECRVNNEGKTKNPAPPVKLGWVCDSEQSPITGCSSPECCTFTE